MGVGGLALTKQDLVVVGHGSLMSGSGLLTVRRGGRSELRAKDAFPVLIRGARRGLAKPSSHGDYLAMDLEPLNVDEPPKARIGLVPTAGEIGALGLVFGRASAPAIARREEYRPDKFVELIGLADHAGFSLGEFLLELSERAHGRFPEYRRALYELLGYTSPGYIFHPLEFDEGFTGIIAIGSGFEGSGAAEVISRRRECGIDRFIRLPEVLEGRHPLAVDRPAQIGYFVECLLGAWHGLDLGDLLEQVELDGAWARDLVRALKSASRDEPGYFLAATSLSDYRYRERFRGGDPQLLSPLFNHADGEAGGKRDGEL